MSRDGETAGGETARTETVRSFVAIPLPGDVQATVFGAGQALARALPTVKWARKVENLHVTLKFLGPVSLGRLEALAEALSAALASLAPFRVDVRGLGAFPTARRANVIWAGVQETQVGEEAGAARLARVAAAVEEAASGVGLGPPERRPFTAHVTVGRCKGGVDARAALAAWADRGFGAAPVDEVHLYESQLGKDASTYVLRSRVSLGRTVNSFN